MIDSYNKKLSIVDKGRQPVLTKRRSKLDSEGASFLNCGMTNNSNLQKIESAAALGSAFEPYNDYEKVVEQNLP